MRRLQLLYALFCTIYAAYVIHGQVSFYLSNRNAPLSGVLICVLVLVVLPTLFGYLLLFRAFPWMGRLIRRWARAT